MLLTLRKSGKRARAGANHVSACKMAATMLRCVSTAPLDKPVVPPVYCKKAMSSSDCGTDLKVNWRPSAMACLNEVTWCLSLKGSSNSGTILAKWRTANVIQRP